MDGAVVSVKTDAVVHAKPLREYGESDSLAQGTDSSPSLEEIADRIYRLESSGGKNDNCKKYGKYNGYGVMSGCFNSVEEARSESIKIIVRLSNKLDLPHALCAYNLGPSSEYLEECVNKSDKYPYYRDYLTL